MAWNGGGQLKIVGLEANADLSTKQWYFVKMTTTNKRVGLASVDGEAVLGVLVNKPSAAGQAAEVVMFGMVKIIAGETITAGDKIKTDASGKAGVVDLTSTGADLKDSAVGTAVIGAAAGELATVVLGVPQGKAE